LVRDNAVMNAYFEALPSSVGAHIRGYKSLEKVWQPLFGKSLQESYMICLRWLWLTILQPIGVRSARLYCWGNTGMWGDFDISTDPAMQRYLETFAISLGKLVVPAPIPVVPIPSPAPAKTVDEQLREIENSVNQAIGFLQAILVQCHEIRG